jgi:hypothetical protein
MDFVYETRWLDYSLLSMSYGKRDATSPRENMAKNPRSNIVSHETEPEKLIKIELIAINGKPYLGQISDDELLYIWVQVFRRKLEELYGVTSTKSLTRHVRAIFKLNQPVKVKEFLEGPLFEYEKFLDDGSSEVISGKILGYDTPPPAELGETTKITVKTNFGVEATGVQNWLKLYGTLTAYPHDFLINKQTGVRSDVYEAEILLKKHVEEFLPMYGQKALVHYPGIPKMCNRCYKVGHMRRECNNIKKDWIAYVNELVEGGIKRELIGSWSNAVNRWKNANSQPSSQPSTN